MGVQGAGISLELGRLQVDYARRSGRLSGLGQFLSANNALPTAVPIARNVEELPMKRLPKHADIAACGMPCRWSATKNYDLGKHNKTVLACAQCRLSPFTL
jgi:hypothetical protein